jgi:hypothetical protein
VVYRSQVSKSAHAPNVCVKIKMLGANGRDNKQEANCHGVVSPKRATQNADPGDKCKFIVVVTGANPGRFGG